ncbi:hypothetical protein [Nocardia noduli]|uniref:hypothetical protein n=1 Tax=Nocardia noduli TaxID=2815722 RepID=UPI001C2428B2|nr:hypothetical protein [Nocardia noduli]
MTTSEPVQLSWQLQQLLTCTPGTRRALLLSLEATMTQKGMDVDDLTGVTGKSTTTVAYDFGLSTAPNPELSPRQTTPPTVDD